MSYRMDRLDPGRRRILLISPRGPLYRNRTGIWKKSLRYAPLTLTTLAALVPEELDAEVVVVDEGIHDIDWDAEADIVGISAITGTAPRSYELADHFRRRGVPVVLGGVHPTLVPSEAARHADSVIVGYAEETWPQLLRDHFSGDGMEKMYVQGHDLNLAGRPFPKREMLPGAKYAKELFEALIPLKIKWGGLATTTFARDEELLDLAARSGCRGLLIGFESLSKESLAETRKVFNARRDYRAIVGRIHERGIAIMGCFVFGFDHDTTETLDETVDFVIEAKIDLPRYAILTPFPGTPLFRRKKERGTYHLRGLDLLRRPTRQLHAGADDPERAPPRHRTCLETDVWLSFDREEAPRRAQPALGRDPRKFRLPFLRKPAPRVLQLRDGPRGRGGTCRV